MPFKSIEKRNQKCRNYYNKNSQKVLSHKRVRKYGLTDDEFLRILKQQNGVCGICSSDTPGGRGTFHVDHCHVENKVRGLLCARCNLGLGYFSDDPDILSKAEQYIRGWKEYSV